MRDRVVRGVRHPGLSAVDGRPALGWGATVARNVRRPSWLGWILSIALHLVVVLLLGRILISVGGPERIGLDIESALRRMPRAESFDELELELKPEPAEVTGEGSLGLPIQPSQILVQVPELRLSRAPARSADLPKFEVASDLITMAGVGSGHGRAGEGILEASFFGIQATGRRLVFVVDNSRSMVFGGRFRKACDELLRTLESLEEGQLFYVILFSDRPYPIFYPDPARDLLLPNDENLDRLRDWLEGVSLKMRTDAREAMEMAFAFGPDAIYLLTDGDFTDNTQRFLIKRDPAVPVIHTIGFEIKDRGSRLRLQAIAEHYRGSFQPISTSWAR